MPNSLSTMMQRTANKNAADFGNQRACQNLKISHNYQNMRIMLAVLGEIMRDKGQQEKSRI